MASYGGMPPPSSIPLSDVRSGAAIGHPGFAEEQRRRTENAQPFELTAMMDDEDLFPPEDKRERELNAMPASTVDGESQESGCDDRKQAILDEQFPTLKGKDARIQTLHKKIADIRATRAGETPRQVLVRHHESVKKLPNGSEKQNAIDVTEAIMTLYDACRYNEDCLDLCANVFSKLGPHLHGKKQMAHIQNEIAMLEELYDDQDDRQAREKAAKKREGKREAREESALEGRSIQLAKKAKADDKKKDADNNKQKKMDTS